MKKKTQGQVTVIVSRHGMMSLPPASVQAPIAVEKPLMTLSMARLLASAQFMPTPPPLKSFAAIIPSMG